MNTFDKLFEAISRREFLRSGKTKNKSPKEVESTPAPVKNIKPPKKITRRSFVKQTGTGGVLSTALNPVDLLFKSWPGIMQGVIKQINPIQMFDNNILSIFKKMTIGDEEEFQNWLPNLLKIKRVLPEILQQLSVPIDKRNKIMETLAKNEKAADLGNFYMDYVNKYGELSTMGDYTLDDILQAANSNPEEYRDLSMLIDKISNYTNIPLKNLYKNEDSIFTTLESINYEWSQDFLELFNSLLDTNIVGSNLINKILERSTGPNYQFELDDILTKQKLKEYIKRNNIQLTQNNEQLIKKYDSMDSEVEKQMKEEEDTKKKIKEEEDKKKKIKDEISYPRFDYAGGSEDKQGIDYTTLENMNAFDKLYNQILQEKTDRCHRRANQVYGKKTSAYKSGAIVRCRKGKIWRKKK